MNDIADLACGAGTMSYHLSAIYPDSSFTLVDLNQDALDLARKVCVGEKFKFFNGDITRLPFEDGQFDCAISMMTLLALDKIACHDFLNETVRIIKPGGLAILSGLFNLDRDVDLFSLITDHTRESAKIGLPLHYITLCRKTISEWLRDSVSSFDILPFHPEIDICYEGRGIGTSTRVCADGVRLQISGGMLMNWGFLVIRK
jgi:ubiquinone/menaquinone biosynthesis C-methylase UbiE